MTVPLPPGETPAPAAWKNVVEVELEHITELLEVEGIDERIDGRVGVSNPKDETVQIVRSLQFLKQDDK